MWLFHDTEPTRTDIFVLKKKQKKVKSVLPRFLLLKHHVGLSSLFAPALAGNGQL